jgi:CMP-N,N'-diacetyllegionaminic acid synthase
MKVLGLIPARGGSKGLPGKNLRHLHGKPLLHHSVENALNASCISTVVVSTDDPNIAESAELAGAEVPFMRPPELAGDTTSSIDVLLHCLDWYGGKGQSFDIVTLIEPTSPLREISDIEKGINLLISKGHGSVVSVCESEGQHPSFSYRKDSNSKIIPFTGKQPTNIRRQDIDPVYFLDGTFYASFVKELRAQRSFYHENTYCFEVPKWKSLEIDDIYDFVMIEAIMKQRLKDHNS